MGGATVAAARSKHSFMLAVLARLATGEPTDARTIGQEIGYSTHHVRRALYAYLVTRPPVARQVGRRRGGYVWTLTDYGWSLARRAAVDPFPLSIVVEGERAEADEPEDAVHLAWDLLLRAREAGVKVPVARFYGPDGTLVREAHRTDLAPLFVGGVCWCGRGALRVKDGVPFCCSKHEVLWGAWDDDLRARTVVARFLAIHAGANVR